MPELMTIKILFPDKAPQSFFSEMGKFLREQSAKEEWGGWRVLSPKEAVTEIERSRK